jgi:hypothetical protein
MRWADFFATFFPELIPKIMWNTGGQVSSTSNWPIIPPDMCISNVGFVGYVEYLVAVYFGQRGLIASTRRLSF